MIAYDHGSSHEATTSVDVVGKVFVALSRDMRQCLICDRVFTKQGSAAHADAVCHPLKGNSGIYGGSDHADR